MYRSSLRTGLVLALIFLVCFFVGLAILVVTIGGSFSSHRLSQRIEALVRQVRAESKLVVASQSVTLTVHRADAKRLLGFIYLGTTEVNLRVDGCQVQYIIPVDKVTKADFQLDSKARKLIVTLHHPQLDLEMIDIPSNPDRWWVRKTSGWARFDKNRMETQVRRELREHLIAQVSNAGWDPALDLVARDSVQAMLSHWLGEKDVQIEVSWR